MMLARLGKQWPVVAAGVVVAGTLVAVGWVDYRATRRELTDLLRDQALSLRETMAAAVRASRAAATQAEQQLGFRLLDNARLIRELDRRGLLDQAALDEIARDNHLFRVTLYDASGRRERVSGGSRGFGPGPGSGSARLLERLLAGAETEALTGLHTGRGGGARVAAGVRRAAGGAIVLNADATAVDEIEHTYSIDALLDDILSSTHELAYIVLEAEGTQFVHGLDAAEVPATAPDPTGDPTPVAEREVAAAGRPVLELAGPVEITGLDRPRLRIGMRLDGVRRAERQTLLRLAGSLSMALVLTLVAIGFLGLRREYGELSERHQAAQQALRRRDRLTAMGELASTVAHEVRNPLNAIAMAARRLTREFAVPDRGAGTVGTVRDTEELRELLAVVEGETRRIDAIVQQFLEFAKPPTLAKRPVEMDRFVHDLADAVRPLAASRAVRLEVELADPGVARVDPAQLRQAIDNLVRNAIEATPASGRVRVRATRVGREHLIEVDDTGPGIEPEHLPRIFDLYYTTKPGGTGVGLAVTHQIVSAHGGTIEVDSRLGAGTRLTVRLPHDEHGHV